MNRFIAAILVAFILLPVASSAQSLKLSGKWQMSYDPDGPVVEDWMIFQSDGTVKFGDNQGIYITCTYDGDADSVVTICDVRGKKKRLSFQVRDNFKKLVNSSGAIYSRAQ